MANIQLRPTVVADLEQLYLFQQDIDARYMAAFVRDETQEAFITRHAEYLNDPTKNTQTILVDNVIIGSVAKFMIENDAEITYWIDKAWWGKGIASKALSAFLEIETTRPIYGRAAFDNIGSQKVLEKCGFVKTGTDSGFANARQQTVEEYIYYHC